MKQKRGKAHLTENDYDYEYEEYDGDDSYFGKGKPRPKGGKKSKGRGSKGDAKGQEKGTFKASGKTRRKGGKKGKGKAHISAEADDEADAASVAEGGTWPEPSDDHYQEYWSPDGTHCWYTEVQCGATVRHPGNPRNIAVRDSRRLRRKMPRHSS